MRKLEISVATAKYPIFIAKGILKNLGRELKSFCSSNKLAIITDTTVAQLYEEQIVKSFQDHSFQVEIIAIQPGEASKSLATAQKIYHRLLEIQFTRGDMIIAFGGGVVGDLAGFVAATLFRGVPYMQVPTSLLAQIDSSIGGKVAVNLPQGKNLIGSFYHPQAVYIDPLLLATLEKKYIYDGMAEVIKYGCIADVELYDSLMGLSSERQLYKSFDEIIFRCCLIKKNFIEQDEHDLGKRMTLNFGHTLGHALENLFAYRRYTHGQAVAIGMYNITVKSEKLGMTSSGTAQQLKAILSKYSLPLAMPTINGSQLVEAIKRDKKNNGSSLKLVLLNQIGEAYLQSINSADIEKFWIKDWKEGNCEL